MADFTFPGGKEMYFCSVQIERAIQSVFSHVPPCRPDETRPAKA